MHPKRKRLNQGCEEYKTSSKSEGRELGDVWMEEMMGLITRSPILYKNIFP